MKKVIIFLIIIFAAVYGGYRYFLSVASDHIITQVTNELITDEMLEQYIEDPLIVEALQKYQGGQTTKDNIPSSGTLAFETKEEATKALISKFSIGEIRDITMMASRGLSSDEQEELENMMIDRFSSEEIEALLIIGIQEISKELLQD